MFLHLSASTGGWADPLPRYGSYWNAFFFYTVFATTAANAEESSYACYLDEKRNTYLGDVYSVKWMEDSDQVTNMHRE